MLRPLRLPGPDAAHECAAGHHDLAGARGAVWPGVCGDGLKFRALAKCDRAAEIARGGAVQSEADAAVGVRHVRRDDDVDVAAAVQRTSEDGLAE